MLRLPICGQGWYYRPNSLLEIGILRILQCQPVEEILDLLESWSTILTIVLVATYRLTRLSAASSSLVVLFLVWTSLLFGHPTPNFPNVQGQCLYLWGRL